MKFSIVGAHAALLLMVIANTADASATDDGKQPAAPRSQAQQLYDKAAQDQEETHRRNLQLMEREEKALDRHDADMLRAEKLLERQEADAARFEKILDTWERQQAAYQKYLDSLPHK